MDLKTMATKAAEKAWAKAADATKPATIRRSVSGTYDPTTGKTGSATVTDYPCDAIVTTYSQNEIKGTSILATDRKVLVRQAQVAAAGEVTTGDKLILGSKAYTIVAVLQDALGILWTLQARG